MQHAISNQRAPPTSTGIVSSDDRGSEGSRISDRNDPTSQRHLDVSSKALHRPHNAARMEAQGISDRSDNMNSRSRDVA